MFEVLPLIFLASILGSSLRIFLRNKEIKREIVSAFLLSVSFVLIVFISIQESTLVTARLSQFCPLGSSGGSPYPFCTESISQFLPFQLNDSKSIVGYFYFFFVLGYVSSDLLDSLVFFLRRIK